MKPHVHAEVIKAWADGAEIEYYCKEFGRWCDIACNRPTWYDWTQYRVKPEPVVKYHGIMQCTEGWEDMNHTTGYYCKPSGVPLRNDKGWKLIAIVKTTFVDNLSVAVELVK